MKLVTPWKTINKWIEKHPDVLVDFEDGDGIWLYCSDKYYFADMDSHTCHEYTVKDCISVLNSYTPWTPDCGL